MPRANVNAKNTVYKRYIIWYLKLLPYAVQRTDQYSTIQPVVFSVCAKFRILVSTSQTIHGYM